MFCPDMVLRSLDDPLEGHPRYERIRWADCDKDNVQVALDRQRNRNVAIKFFKRGPCISDNVRREILHHAQLHHVNVISLYHVFLTSQYLCISMELGAQNLWQHVHSEGGRLSEADAQSIFIQLIDGVQYCHSQSVANRDIKLQNCLVVNVFKKGVQYLMVKICDFGYCKHVEKDSLPKSLVGTAAYLSPDILTSSKDRGYDALMVDIWCCGIILYYLLEGRFPFGTEASPGGLRRMQNRIKQLEYDQFVWAGYGAQDLLSKIFLPSDLRITMDQLQDHWWIKSATRREDMKNLRSLQKQGSTSNVDQQSMEEIERLISEACVETVSEDKSDADDMSNFL